jgi:hypothetical protein
MGMKLLPKDKPQPIRIDSSPAPLFFDLVPVAVAAAPVGARVGKSPGLAGALALGASGAATCLYPVLAAAFGAAQFPGWGLGGALRVGNAGLQGRETDCFEKTFDSDGAFNGRGWPHCS